MADEMSTFDPATDGMPVDAEPAVSAPDPDIADAAEALAGQLEKPGSTPAAKPATPPPAQETKPAGSPRADGYKRFQQGAQGRFQREKAELRERRARESALEEQVRRNNEFMQQQLDIVKSLRPAEPEKEIPDPVLDPAAFQKWALTQTQESVNAALKPIIEAEQRRQAQVDEILQEREQTAHVEQVTTQLIDQYQGWEAEYIREAPELAHGFQDRFHTMRDSIMAPSFVDAGYTEKEAADMVNLWFHAISQSAASNGQNPAAVLDAWFEGIARRFGYEPIGAEDLGGGQAQQQPAAPRQRTEIERQAAVQNRARGAATAAPRVASRVAQPSSMLEEAYRGGERDHRALRSAAMRDSHGDPKAAAMALSRLAAQV